MPHWLGSPGEVLWIKAPQVPCTVALLIVWNEVGRKTHTEATHLDAVSKQR